MTTFTVDTHLFRELGELLVGRDSTALVELIKNAYDADATKVVLYGEGLTSTTRGFITIGDNGIGMSRAEFENGFLRIAARTKETNKRRSPVFERRYTGAKGIGRLAAHKLARTIEIESLRWNADRRGSSDPLLAEQDLLRASIDWDKVEAQKTLDDVDATDAIKIEELPTKRRSLAGTRLEFAQSECLIRALCRGLDEPLASTTAPRLLKDRTDTRFMQLGELATVHLGGVTGDASYFLLSEEERKEWRLPTAGLRPVLTRARHLRSAETHRTQWESLRIKGERVWLFSPPPRLVSHPAVQKYLRYGESGGCNLESHKISNRSVWYSVPLPRGVDAFISGMTQIGPWLSFCKMGRLTASNTLYVVHFKNRDEAHKAAVALSMLSSPVRAQALATGRRYADGLVKFEPADLRSLRLPLPESIVDAKKLYRLAVKKMLRGDKAAATEIADAFIHGVSPPENVVQAA